MTDAAAVSVDPARLMSGVRLEDLALPPSMNVSPTGGSCGAIVRDLDLADDLSGAVISGLLDLLERSTTRSPTTTPPTV